MDSGEFGKESEGNCMKSIEERDKVGTWRIIMARPDGLDC